MIAQHMIRSYTHKIWCHVVMKCYKHQIKYIRHCFPLPTPGLTPVPSRSDAPATWPPSFLRDLAGIPTADVRIYSYINQQINSDIDIQWKYIIHIYLHIYIFFPHTPFYCASVFHGLGWQPARDREFVPVRVSKKGWGGRGGQYCGW